MGRSRGSGQSRRRWQSEAAAGSHHIEILAVQIEELRDSAAEDLQRFATACSPLAKLTESASANSKRRSASNPQMTTLRCCLVPVRIRMQSG
jgi:hypothetical protein